MVNLIVAVGNYIVNKGYPIGKGGGIPWHNSFDMKWFKETTTGHPVIMGRRTYESLGKPLPNRVNIVVSRKNDLWQDNADARICDTVEKAIAFAKTIDEEIFIIGGASIYKYVLDNNLVDRLLVDFLAEEVSDADSFFPDIFSDNKWFEEGSPIEIEPRKAYALTYSRQEGVNNHVDEQYLNLVNEILEKGVEKDTRAGKTLSLFGKQLRFNLKEGLPMLTTKKMFAKGVIHELLWFLNGDTNIKYLVDNGVHIWDDDAYRYYLTLIDKHNEATQTEPEHDWFKRSALPKLSKEEFMQNVREGNKQWLVVDKHAYIMSYQPNAFEYEYKFGDLGPVYGHQWTNWGESYWHRYDFKGNRYNGGINQVKNLIETLKKNPDDRRLMISAWNVGNLADMALPPCHYACQFYTKEMTIKERKQWAIDNRIEFEHYDCYSNPSDEEIVEMFDKAGVPKRKLSCMWQQRSVDSLLGLPFNILSYAILTHLIAQCCDMDVDELIFTGGDVHVYKNQIDAYVAEQKERNPHLYGLPKLVLNKDITNIEDFKYEDIKIEGYKSYPTVKYPLSVGL